MTIFNNSFILLHAFILNYSLVWLIEYFTGSLFILFYFMSQNKFFVLFTFYIYDSYKSLVCNSNEIILYVVIRPTNQPNRISIKFF